MIRLNIKNSIYHGEQIYQRSNKKRVNIARLNSFVRFRLSVDQFYLLKSLFRYFFIKRKFKTNRSRYENILSTLTKLLLISIFRNHKFMFLYLVMSMIFLFGYLDNFWDWYIKADIHVGKVKHKNNIAKFWYFYEEKFNKQME